MSASTSTQMGNNGLRVSSLLLAHSTSRTCLISSSVGKSIVAPACHFVSDGFDNRKWFTHVTAFGHQNHQCTFDLPQAHYTLDALERGGCRGAYCVRALLEDVLQHG